MAGPPPPLSKGEIKELYASTEAVSVEDEKELRQPLPEAKTLLTPDEFEQAVQEYDRFSKGKRGPRQGRRRPARRVGRAGGDDRPVHPGDCPGERKRPAPCSRACRRHPARGAAPDRRRDSRPLQGREDRGQARPAHAWSLEAVPGREPGRGRRAEDPRSLPRAARGHRPGNDAAGSGGPVGPPDGPPICARLGGAFGEAGGGRGGVREGDPPVPSMVRRRV